MFWPKIRFGIVNRTEIFTISISRQDHSLLNISAQKDKSKWKIISQGGKSVIHHQVFKFWIDFFSQCFVYHFVVREILYRLIYNRWGFILIMTKYFLQKSQSVNFLRENHDIVCYNLAKLWRIILIFELDREIGETILWVKILSPSDDHSKSYCVNGRSITLTDIRVYSLFEYVKTIISHLRPICRTV